MPFKLKFRIPNTHTTVTGHEIGKVRPARVTARNPDGPQPNAQRPDTQRRSVMARVLDHLPVKVRQSGMGGAADITPDRPQPTPQQAIAQPNTVRQQNVPPTSTPQNVAPANVIGRTNAAKGLQSIASQSTTGAAATGSARPMEFETRDGEKFPSVNTLSDAQKAEFNKRFDPVQVLGLTDDSVVFRVMEKKFLQAGSRVGGNDISVAEIANHQAVRPNPGIAQMERLAAADPNARAYAQERITQMKGLEYIPVSMVATDLPQASLNVMHGPGALAAVEYYARGHDEGEAVIVSMTLGDMKLAGGGEVFFDTGNPVTGGKGSESDALIITLPKKASMLVTVVDPNNTGIGTSS